MAFQRGSRFPVEKVEKKKIILGDRDARHFRLEYEPIASTSTSTNTYRVKKVQCTNTKPVAPVASSEKNSPRISISKNSAYEEKLKWKNSLGLCRNEILKRKQSNDSMKWSIEALITLLKTMEKMYVLWGMPPSANLTACLEDQTRRLKVLVLNEKTLKTVEENIKKLQFETGCSWEEIHKKYGTVPH